MERTQIRRIDAPFGEVWLSAADGCLTGLTFAGEAPFERPGSAEQRVLDEAERQLRAYFAGRLRAFDLPLRLGGTPFQQSVWRALGQIPYGKTATYAYIARAVGRPRAFRAVGMANHSNPISIVIPCHRVVGASGALTGYAGGLDAKRWLLDHERRWADVEV